MKKLFIIFFLSFFLHNQSIASEIWTCNYSKIHNLKKNDKYQNEKIIFEVDLDKKEVLWRNLKNTGARVLGKDSNFDVHVTFYPGSENHDEYWLVSFLKEQVIIDIVGEGKKWNKKNILNRIIFNCSKSG